MTKILFIILNFPNYSHSYIIKKLQKKTHCDIHIVTLYLHGKQILLDHKLINIANVYNYKTYSAFIKHKANIHYPTFSHL